MKFQQFCNEYFADILCKISRFLIKNFIFIEFYAIYKIFQAFLRHFKQLWHFLWLRATYQFLAKFSKKYSFCHTMNTLASKKREYNTRTAYAILTLYDPWKGKHGILCNLTTASLHRTARCYEMVVNCTTTIFTVPSADTITRSYV